MDCMLLPPLLSNSVLRMFLNRGLLRHCIPWQRQMTAEEMPSVVNKCHQELCTWVTVFYSIPSSLPGVLTTVHPGYSEAGFGRDTNEHINLHPKPSNDPNEPLVSVFMPCMAVV